MAETLTADAQIQEIATAYALDAVDFAANNFKITLDWSDQSVQQIEQILGFLHDDLDSAKPPEEAVWNFAKVFGSYVGEVLRKNHGAQWGIVTLHGESMPGMQQSGLVCWPWGRAHKRIQQGPENNTWHYYQLLLRQAIDPLRDAEPETKPWWRFW